MQNRCLSLFAVTALGFTCCFVSAESKPAKNAGDSKSHAAEKKALEEFNSLIGGWRGVGQPKRNSTRGAWIESAEWVWDFKDNGVAVRYVVNNGKMLKSARLTYDPKAKLYQMKAKLADDIERTYRGPLEKNGKLVLVSEPDKQDYSYRLTVTRLNEKRTIVLYERRSTKEGQFFRIAGVGYTRKGTSLAIEGAGEPVCVVTGGKGTIKVSYKGKTYYVCCSGCKQAFDEDPEGVLADYRKRLAAKKKNQ